MRRAGVYEQTIFGDAYFATGVTLSVGGRPLAPGEVVISNPWFWNRFPGGGLGPHLNLGLDAFAKQVVFLANSTGAVCLSGPRSAP